MTFVLLQAVIDEGNSIRGAAKFLKYALYSQ